MSSDDQDAPFRTLRDVDDADYTMEKLVETHFSTSAEERNFFDSEESAKSAFRQWLAEEIQKAKAEALRDAVNTLPFPIDPYGGFDPESLRAAHKQAQVWLRGRADREEAA